MNQFNHYKIIADVFRYPDKDLKNRMSDFLNLTEDHFPEQLEKAGFAINKCNQMTILQQQEYYLKTFDVKAICYLDIGYVLFGEDYKRAQLLVNLQSEHKTAGIDCGSELGDHLPNVLELLSKTTDQAFAEELGYIITTPAVRFMVTKFNNINNYYKDLLEVLLIFLQSDFKGEQLAEYAVPEQAFNGKNDFLIPSSKSVICDTHCNKRKTY